MEIRKILEILWRRKWVIAQSFAVIVGVCVLICLFMTPIYKSTAVLLVEPRQGGQGLASLESLMSSALGQMFASEGMMDNEMEVLKSERVRGAVARKLELEDSDGNKIDFVPLDGPGVFTWDAFYGMEVTRVSRRGSVLEIEAYGPSKEEAREIARSLVDVYMKERQEHLREGIRNVLVFLDVQLPVIEEKVKVTTSELRLFMEREGSVSLPDEIRVAIEYMADLYQELQEDRVHLAASISMEDILSGQEKDLRENLQDPQEIVNDQLSEILGRLYSAQADVEALKAREESIKTAIKDFEKQLHGIPGRAMELAQLELANRVAQTSLESLMTQRLQAQIMEAMQVSDVWVLAEPREPRKPNRPDWILTMVVAVFVSMVFGTGLSLVIEYVDDRVRGADDVEETLGVPVSAVLPYIRTDETGLLSLDPAAAVTLEPMRRLVFNLHMLGVDKRIATVAVTSSGASEGKSLTASNLTICEALSGKKVLLIDVDLLRPALTTLFGVRQIPGLTEWITGDAELDDAVQPIEIDEKHSFSLLACGAIPANRLSVIASTRFREKLQSLKDQYDLVVIDTPPILPVDDARVLAPMVDAMVLVAAIGQVHRRALTAAAQLLKHDDYPPMLPVVNKYRRHVVGYDSYHGYQSYYGADESEHKRSLFGRKRRSKKRS